ncbi:MAG: helix-turn-helix domain-containing protein [Thermoplasmata archaeon]
MICEMCGAEMDRGIRIRLERSVLSACPKCARFGQPVEPPTPAPARPGVSPVPLGRGRPSLSGRRLAERDVFSEMPELELAGDWARRIRAAREALGWTPDDLGRKLNEKKSVVLKLESGNFRPPDALVGKLERLLKVRLRDVSVEPTDGR